MRKQLNNGNERKNSAIGDGQGPTGQDPEAHRTGHAAAGVTAPDHAEVPPTTRLRRLLPTAWAMIRPYWSSEDRWAAWGLLLAVVALTLGDGLPHRSLESVEQRLLHRAAGQELVPLSRAAVPRLVADRHLHLLAVYQVYLNQMLEIRWRRWLTDRYLRAWLADGAYYRMQLVARETDNPDQRIAEDVHLLISHTLALLIGGLRAIVTLVTFVAILWGLSGTLTVPLGGSSLTLPGYMVWVAILYAIGGTWLTDWIGRPLVRLNFDQQRYEADFRFSLVRFRENTEGVALYRGEADEFRGFRERFEAVVSELVGHHAPAEADDLLHLRLRASGVDLPVVVAAPRYFRGELGLGGLMQTIGAFSRSRIRSASSSSRTRRSRNGARWSSGSPASSARSSTCAFRRRPAAASGASTETRASDRGGCRSLSTRWPAAHRERESLALARRHRAPGGSFGFGKEHALPCHRRDLAVWARRDPRTARPPRSLSAAEAVPADRHAPGSGELSDAGRRAWTTRRCARRSRPSGSLG